ncbi:NADH dehydrogenase [ubiquinone] 1 beta subcomplex subunit 3 [Dermatophagoides pteronyssinus]|uniref:NADH dehydrogenase [ubiquinone] 1 beta subcomplex subunit 3 n=1 Tax=Dermatophagoides pteronyssinus TaxID=6956 RepID=UPI003F67DA9D
MGLVSRIFGGPISDTGPSAPRKPTPGLNLPPGAYIPDYKIYKVEDAPELLTIQRRLAARGLKSHWLRNEVWRYNRKQFGTEAWRIASLITYGWKYAVPLLIVTAIYENYFNKDGHHGGGGHHDDHGHSDSHH